MRWPTRILRLPQRARLALCDWMRARCGLPPESVHPDSPLARTGQGSPLPNAPPPIQIEEEPGFGPEDSREFDLGAAAEPIDADLVPTPVTGPPADFDPAAIDLTGVEPMDPDAAKTVPDGRRAPSSHPPGRLSPKREGQP